MEGQVRRSDDQRPLDQSTGFELFQQQPGHDRLTSTWIVRQ